MGRLIDDRLDILAHAHDIQGLGHIARTVGILARLRNMRPQTKALIVTGSPLAETIIANSVDWMKLPGFATSVSVGAITTLDSPTGLSHSSTVRARARLLATLLQETRPRIVLVDHRPTGQEDELLEAIDCLAPDDCRWILGMRAVVGDDEPVWTRRALDFFRSRYAEIVWYGDSEVLGDAMPLRLKQHFGVEPTELGYVSRAHELDFLGHLKRPEQREPSAVLAITRFSQETIAFLESFTRYLECHQDQLKWHCYIGPGEEGAVKRGALGRLAATRRDISISTIDRAGPYLERLACSQLAVLFGGYNSLMDIAWAQTPSLVIVRPQLSGEQRVHSQHLEQTTQGVCFLREAGASALAIGDCLRSLRDFDRALVPVKCDGGFRAARHLSAQLDNLTL